MAKANQRIKLETNDRDGIADLKTDERGFINLSTLFILLGAFITGLLLLTALDLLLPDMIPAVVNVSTTFTDTEWGNPLANALGNIFGWVIPVAFMGSIVAVPFAVFAIFKGIKVKSGGSSGY